MGSLDSLKALLHNKKKEKQELVGDRKYIKKSELEEARLKRLREEEEQERRAKEEKRRKLQGSSATADDRPTTPADQPIESPAAATHASPVAADNSAAAAASGGPVLPRDEVIRRLRALGQPTTLFGEEDADRLGRLHKVEKTVKLVDETRGGQENVMRMLQRQDKLSKQQGSKAGGTDAASKADAAAAASNKAAGGADGPGPAADKAGGSGKQFAGGSGTATPGRSAAAAADGSGDEVLKAFQEAAARVAAQRVEEALPLEDRIIKQLRGWCKEWEDDLAARTEEVKQSGPGHHATVVFRQSMAFFEPLYERLQKRQLVEELKVGLSLMVQHIQDRNYLAANDVYLALAIGNAPWPIGVTHVGLHERSAREKISHVMNASSMAHIMNDEASRKFFQALKRLITNLQRIRPTDPSKCVDFSVHGDEGRGVAGGGSNRAALLEAQQKGELPAALPAAPHMLAADGSVKIPPKWDNVLKRQAQGLGIKHFGAGSDSDSEDDRPPSRGPAAGKTPPRSPLPA